MNFPYVVESVMEVKYLGVILDDKLTWKARVNAQVKKGLRAQELCNAFIYRAWGLSPKMTLWLYKCMIIHNITYAAVVWLDIMDIALVRSDLERFQGATCTMITEAMRTTPTKVPEMLLDLPTLGMAVESAALIVAYRLLRPDLRNLGIGYNRI